MGSLTLTFDNLGEATALQRGQWDRATPLGRDPSVLTALPRLLDELDRTGLRATFCVEAINCGLNPDAVREIDARGHELALHGWRHETWSELEPDHERELLRRGTEAFAALGIAIEGFRPPGGELAADDPALLAEHGVRWCSAERSAAHPPGTVAWVPFDWELVDAYWLMESFAGLRDRRGSPAACRTPAEAGARLRERLDAPAAHHTLVMHPFLMLDERWWAQARGLLETIGRRVARRELRCRTAGESAAAAAR